MAIANVAETALSLDRELMALSGVGHGKAAPCHDRGLEPQIVGHRDILELSAMQIARQRRILASFS
jgi:hypothetical protein